MAAASGGGGQPSAGGRSHLVAGSRIVGDLDAPGVIEVAGHVQGRVSADIVVIEPGGEVEGEIAADAITVRGTFSGRMQGGAVRLHATARLSGEVVYGSLSIEGGAEVTARLAHAAPVDAAAPAEGAQAAAQTA